MQTYTFTLIAAGEISMEQTEQLYAACDDVAVSSSNGMWRVEFDREDQSLQNAIASAKLDLKSIGVEVRELTIGAEELASL